jgi:hypothetical protein
MITGSYALFTPDAFDQNFEIAILFKRVQKLKNYNSLVDKSPRALGEVL